MAKCIVSSENFLKTEFLNIPQSTKQSTKFRNPKSEGYSVESELVATASQSSGKAELTENRPGICALFQGVICMSAVV